MKMATTYELQLPEQLARVGLRIREAFFHGLLEVSKTLANDRKSQ